jgi:Bifunctional DNA primase/polymerase, N-terminal
MCDRNGPGVPASATGARNRVPGLLLDITVSNPAPSPDVVAWPREYHCRGWRVVPIPAGRKGPVMRDWQHFEARGDDLPGLFGGGENVGVILDTLADVVIDCPEAIALVALYLAATRAIVGKPSQPRSHRIYTAPVREAHPSASKTGPR